MSECKVSLHFRLSEVQIAIFQSQIVVNVIIVFNVYRRCIRFGIKNHIRRKYFDFARRNVFVLRASFFHNAFYSDDIFASESVSLFKKFLWDFVVKSNLHDSRFIS